ncbi:hypothetical protein ACFFRR_006371 [Megaselia abdita]
MEQIESPNAESSFTRFYNWVVEIQDPRTSSWPLLGSPIPLICILTTYLLFCNYIGPYLMKDRKPFELKKTLIVYNFLQVLINIYLVYECTQCGWGFKEPYNLLCEPISYDRSPRSMRMARACYSYYLVKLIELLDTVFFIMRKKFNQVTFLHVYHHFAMPAASFIGTKYLAGGHGTFFGFMNTQVHIIMYAYYLLAALGPNMQKFLWWKKYITIVQIVQFVLIFIHSVVVQFQPNCTYPKFIAFAQTGQATMFIYLFTKFYIKAYVSKEKKN